MEAAIDRRLLALDEILTSERPKSALEVACIQRQIDDLKNDGNDGLVWNEEEAQRVVEFAKLQRHWKGKQFAGKQFIPESWQEQCIFAPLFGWYRETSSGLLRRFNEGYVEEPRKNGKMLSLDTVLPTPSGWTTMGEVQIGDIVFDENGCQCRVTHITDIDLAPDSYLLKFSNGQRVRACADHQWLTTARVDLVGCGVGGRKLLRGKRKSEWKSHMRRVRTTREIADTLLYGKRGDFNHTVEMPRPLVLPERFDLPIDPYVLGVWLGDGTSIRTEITASIDDLEIVSLIQQCGTPARVRRIDPRNGRVATIALNDGKGGKSELNYKLKASNLLGNKHVPREYLRASILQRLALVQGLMDTDGSISKSGRQIEFSTTSIPLRDAFQELLSSLGIKWRAKRVETTGSPAYRIQFMAFADEVPVFRLSRKLARMRNRSGCTSSPRSRTATIVSAERIQTTPMRCITVDSPSHLYLFGETMLPTHNTFLAATIGSQGLIADGEEGPEVYSAATTRDQASLVFKDAKNCLSGSPLLSKHVKIFTHAITCPANNGTFQAVSSDYNFLQGKGPYRVVIDELHAHKNRDVYDALKTGMGARQNAMLFCITTAGFDRSSICWERREFARQVLEKHIEEPTFFAFISCADVEEDFCDPLVWWKANPNLDISLQRDYLESESRKARASAAAENTFRRLHLNMWTQQSVRWLPMHLWDSCGEQFTEADLLGRECFAAVDFASTRDTNALACLFPFDDGSYRLLCWFWVPEESSSERAEQERRQVMNWAEQGYIRRTHGNVADFDGQIPSDLLDILGKFEVRSLAYDPWGAAEAVIQKIVNGGFPLEKIVKFRQTIGQFAAPTKEFERLVASGKLLHNRDPVLRWMASNVAVWEDCNGNIRPDKANSADKIDGIVAGIMALSEAKFGESEEPNWDYTPGDLAL